MSTPTYVTLPELPGQQHFNCSRLLATISTHACAAMWRQANHEDRKDRALCKGCPLGARHAGEPDASMSPLMGSSVCNRCQRPASRLIRGELCPSCYNRQREYCKGRNAKGGKPVKLANLTPRCVRYVRGREPCMARRELTTNITEVMVAVLKDSRKTVAFGFHSRIVGERQLRLFW